jgi:hypothetical protein
MDWSQSKLIRIESGAVNISTNDLRALLNHYSVDPARIETLVDLARAARETTRWSVYKDVATPELLAFLGYESSASIIRNAEPFWMPGLLQTEEYARIVISNLEARNPHRIDPLVDLRMERQEVLVRQPPGDFHFIMDEAVIRRVIGGHDVMRRQLRHLRKLIEEDPHIYARIVPFEHGMYPRQLVSYWLFEFPNPEDEYILYVESFERGEYIIRESSSGEEDRDSPVHYLETFYGLEQIVSREDTLDLLQDAIARLTKTPPRLAAVTEAGEADPQQG